MKTTFLFIVFILLISFSSCKKDNPKTEFDISENQTNWTKYPFDKIDWTSESPSAFFSIGINDIYFINDKIGYIIGFVAYHESYSQVYKTTDGGLNWSKYFNWEGGAATYGTQIQFFDEKNGFMVGEGMEPSVFKIENNQITSYDIDSLSNDYPYNGPMFFIDSLNGIIKNRKTLDGGNTWQSIFSEFYFNISDYYFLNKSIGVACSRDGLLIKTTDLGTSWDTLLQNNEYEFNCIYMLDSLTIIAGGNKLIKSVDGGVSWYKIYDYQNVYDIEFISNVVGFVATTNYILKTMNAGETWEQNYHSDIISFKSLFVIDENTIVSAGRHVDKNKGINHAYIIKTTTQGE